MAVVQKPHYITVGATYLDAKFLNMDLATYEYLARIPSKSSHSSRYFYSNIYLLNTPHLVLCTRVIKAVYMSFVPIISGPQEYNKSNLDRF